MQVRWTLRGLATNWGVHDRTANPAGLVRQVFILYNTLKGQGPPSFIDWAETADPAYQQPAGCTDKVHVSGARPGGRPSLYAIPHCLTFPAGGNPPGRTRAASQMQAHRIPGLSEVFFLIEDDIIPTGPFERSEWVNEVRVTAMGVPPPLSPHTRTCTRARMHAQHRRAPRQTKSAPALSRTVPLARAVPRAAMHRPWRG